MNMHTSQTFSRSTLLLLALLTLFWGVNWPVMKMVLAEVPPLYFRSACLVGGGAGILAIAAAAGQQLAVPRAHWWPLLMISATNMIGWNVFAVYGVSLLPAGRAALLGYTMPLWSVPLSAWLLREPLHLRHVAGVALGMVGVAFLVGEDFGRIGGSPGGVLCMLTAAFFWGWGVVLLKRYALPIPTSTLTGWSMLAGGVPMLAAAIAFETPQLHPIGPWVAGGVLYNIFIAFMFCYWAWNRIVLTVPVAVSSLSSLMVPVIGVGSSMLLLGERPGWHDLFGGLLILAAITTVLPVFKRPEG